MSDNNVTNSVEIDSTVACVGRVKWFNSKTGYGFVTITDGAKSGVDVFVHHSAISVGNQQYKYLMQGEYVEFILSPLDDNIHSFSVSNVSGIKGGQLMCETRRDLKIARHEYKNNTYDVGNKGTCFLTVERVDRRFDVPRIRGEGPRSDITNLATSFSGRFAGCYKNVNSFSLGR